MIIDGVNIIEKLDKYKKNNIIVAGHDYSDVDSIVSGYLLSKILNNNGYKTSYILTDKIIFFIFI